MAASLHHTLQANAPLNGNAAPAFEATEDGGEVIADTEAFQLMELSHRLDSTTIRHVKPVKLYLVRYGGTSPSHKFGLHIVKPEAVSGHARFCLPLDGSALTITPGDADMLHPVRTLPLGATEGAVNPNHLVAFILHRTSKGLYASAVDGALGALAQIGHKDKVPHIEELGLAFTDAQEARGWFLGIAAVMGVITKDNPHFIAHAQMPTMQRHMANRLAMSWGLI